MPRRFPKSLFDLAKIYNNINININQPPQTLSSGSRRSKLSSWPVLRGISIDWIPNHIELHKLMESLHVPKLSPPELKELGSDHLDFLLIAIMSHSYASVKPGARHDSAL